MTMLYRSTDRLCRCGAPMQNLAHSASFDSDDNNEPSKLGIKHLAHQAEVADNVCSEDRRRFALAHGPVEFPPYGQKTETAEKPVVRRRQIAVPEVVQYNFADGP